MTAVLKAHGVKPEWKSYNWTALTPECQAEFRRIILRWHDLRQRVSDDSEGASDKSTNSQDDQDLEIWLGVRDGIRNWVITAA